jgi:hypothetical protein
VIVSVCKHGFLSLVYPFTSIGGSRRGEKAAVGRKTEMEMKEKEKRALSRKKKKKKKLF